MPVRVYLIFSLNDYQLPVAYTELVFYRGTIRVTFFVFKQMILSFR